MRLLSRAYLLFVLAFSLAFFANNANAFVVNAIQFQGLEGISQQTALNYMPVHIGEDFNPADSSSVISALYATGFYSNVSLAQQGNTLVVFVEERPTICSIEVTGNKLLAKDKIDPVLKSIGLVQGQVFDHSSLDRLVYSLEGEYHSEGKFNVIITPTVQQLPRNRVAIKIDISEGRSVLVKQITIIGNHAFSSGRLIRQMKLTTPRPWTFITHTDQYTEEKMNDSLEAIRSYYLDRGYVHFNIDSAQTTLTPDHRYVYLVIHVTEGPIYRISGFQLAGNTIIPACDMAKAIKIAPGSLFSRQGIRAATDTVNMVLGTMGYLYSNVNVTPQIDECNHTVALTFYADPGARIYIHRINFIGNTKTEDVVLRRLLQQNEATVADTLNIKESERLLNISGYVDSAHGDTVPVPGVPDQADLNYKINEAASAAVTAGAGYGTQGYILNAGINQPNFMGTGRTAGINVSNSLYMSSVSLNYLNPYYTDDGISRGVTLYGQRTTPGKVNIATYATNTFGGSVNYGIPLNAFGDMLQLSYGYQYLNLQIGSTPSLQLQNFVNSYGSNFYQTLLGLGWTHNSLDKTIFPTQGLYENASLQLSLPGSRSSNANYYKSSYYFSYYHPIGNCFIINARGTAGYGAGLGPTKGLPFFSNFYAGGIGSTGIDIRGFQVNTLGPLDSNQDPLGGNALVAGTLGIIFPNPVGGDKLRTTAFFDAGNVYSTKGVRIGGTGSGPVRCSTGLAVDWRVPVMNVLMEIYAAKVLNPQPGDNTRVVDFSVGTSF